MDTTPAAILLPPWGRPRLATDGEFERVILGQHGYLSGRAEGWWNRLVDLCGGPPIPEREAIAAATLQYGGGLLSEVVRRAPDLMPAFHVLARIPAGHLATPMYYAATAAPADAKGLGVAIRAGRGERDEGMGIGSRAEAAAVREGAAALATFG